VRAGPTRGLMAIPSPGRLGGEPIGQRGIAHQAVLDISTGLKVTAAAEFCPL
jgi:hypothetical protein